MLCPGKFGLFKLKALNHGILAAAIHNRQPACLSNPARVRRPCERNATIKSPSSRHRCSRIFSRAEADVVAVEIAAGWVRRGEGPEIVVECASLMEASETGSAVSYCETDCIDHSKI